MIALKLSTLLLHSTLLDAARPKLAPGEPHRPTPRLPWPNHIEAFYRLRREHPSHHHAKRESEPKTVLVYCAKQVPDRDLEWHWLDGERVEGNWGSSIVCKKKFHWIVWFQPVSQGEQNPEQVIESIGQRCQEEFGDGFHPQPADNGLTDFSAFRIRPGRTEDDDLFAPAALKIQRSVNLFSQTRGFTRPFTLADVKAAMSIPCRSGTTTGNPDLRV